MNVLFDISVLGEGVYYHTSRTGVARAIESLAIELNDIAPGQVRLCAASSIRGVLQTLSYLKTSKFESECSFSLPDSQIAQSALPLLAHLQPSPEAFPIIRRAFNFSLKAAGSLLASPGGRDLAWADIFHATLSPCPRRVKSTPGLAQFLTIYDLVPILYPQFFRNDPEHFLHEVVASITPDQWIVAISQNTKDDLCSFANVDPSRVFVTHLAASELFYPCEEPRALGAARVKHGIPDGPYILSLSTLEPRKNIDQTIRSFIDLVRQQTISDLSLVLVGTKGWDFDRIFAEIEGANSVRDRIIVTGYVQDPYLAPLYSGAMMFVYPSFYEGFGLPPLEAMQCGVPVITSNTSSLPEVVGNAGSMVDPTDQDALTQAMFDLYRSEALRLEMSARGLDRARQFSWRNCATTTLSAYRTALPPHRADY